MKRSHLILFIGGALVAIGMVLSYIGATFITDGLSVKEGIVSQGSSIELTKGMDPSITKTGVFVVHADKFDSLKASVFDPDGQLLVSKEIEQKSTEEEFEISVTGDHMLVLENLRQDEVPVIIGISHMPEKWLVAVNMLGQSLIISGFIAVIISFFYFIKNRKKTS